MPASTPASEAAWRTCSNGAPAAIVSATPAPTTPPTE